MGNGNITGTKIEDSAGLRKIRWMGNLGFLLGIAGCSIVAIPLTGSYSFFGKTANAIIGLSLSSVGLVISIIQPKQYADQVSQAAIAAGIIGIVLAIISLVSIIL